MAKFLFRFCTLIFPETECILYGPDEFLISGIYCKWFNSYLSWLILSCQCLAYISMFKRSKSLWRLELVQSKSAICQHTQSHFYSIVSISHNVTIMVMFQFYCRVNCNVSPNMLVNVCIFYLYFIWYAATRCERE